MSKYNNILNNLEKTREHLALTAGIGKGEYIEILSDTIDFLIEMRDELCNSLCSNNNCEHCDYTEV